MMEEVVDTTQLRSHVRLLGDMLGNIVKENAGEALLSASSKFEFNQRLRRTAIPGRRWINCWLRLMTTRCS